MAEGGGQTWPRASEDPAGERERAIAKVLAEGGVRVVETGESRIIKTPHSEAFNALPENLRKQLVTFAERANTYLASPMMIDRFDHKQQLEREAWRDRQPGPYAAEIRAFLRNNRMRGGATAHLGTPLGMVVKYVAALPEGNPVKSVLSGPLDELHAYYRDQFTSSIYARASIPDRQGSVQRLSQLLRDYLDAFVSL